MVRFALCCRGGWSFFGVGFDHRDIFSNGGLYWNLQAKLKHAKRGVWAVTGRYPYICG